MTHTDPIRISDELHLRNHMKLRSTDVTLRAGLACLVYFLISAVICIFLPTEYIWDERLFLPEVERLAIEPGSLIDKLRGLQSPMGPLYFLLYAGIWKLCMGKLLLMRWVHLVLSTGLLYILALRLKKFPKAPWLWLAFLLNPYFLVMTGPLLYTDVLGLIFIFLGHRLYFKKKDFLLAGLLWGLAICTRQLLIVYPLAIGLMEVYRLVRTREFQWKRIASPILSALCFLPLYLLWGDVNSGAFGMGQFQENTLRAFSWSWKALNYSLAVCGLWLLVARLVSGRLRWGLRLSVLSVITLLMCILAEPTLINANMAYGNLPDTAGLLDIVFSNLSYAAYPVAAVLMAFTLDRLCAAITRSSDYIVIFYAILIVLFVLLESVYSYVWDKHFLLIIPALLELPQLLADKPLDLA